jgi:hypothetical protein
VETHSHIPQRGVALVIVLAFLVLMTGLVVAFLSRSATDRQIAHNSYNEVKADQLARGALDIVTGDLKQEIVNGSTPDPTPPAPSDLTVYTPTFAPNLLPMRSGNPSGSPDPIPNLVRRSIRSDPIISPGVPSRASAVNSTTDISLNSRSISLARWNKHYLVPRSSGANPTDTTPVPPFAAPDWVFVTNNGPTVISVPTSNVIGRYAYAIYDEGGLIDVNVGGYPTATTALQYGRKGVLSFADLTVLANMSQGGIDDVVGWRNYASAQPTGTFTNFTFDVASATRYFNFVTSNRNGFMTVTSNTWNNPTPRTDQEFVDRQSLIKLRGASGFTANALQYLATFSRELNAPSWSPSTPAGSTIDYATQKDSATSANRALPNIRATATFTRVDGTTSQVGEPLVKTRFPLSRIAALGPNGIVTIGTTTIINGAPSASTAATVQRDFGLVWNTDHWEYCGPTGNIPINSIALIGSIGNREPNFFELLKAGILSGSLGKDAGKTGTYFVNYEEGPASGLSTQDTPPTAWQPVADCQIIQIGANIIDQYDADSYPTEIRFKDNVSNAIVSFYGIENLPYMQRSFAKTLSPDKDASGNDVPKQVGGWLMAEVWNPHQDAGYTAATTPTSFKFRGEGLVEMFHRKADGSTDTGPVHNLANSGYVDFITTAANFRDPTCLSKDTTLIRSADCTPTNGSNGTNDPYGNHLVVGLRAGYVQNSTDDYGGIEPLGCDLILEYKTASGSYKIYDRMKNLRGAQQGSASSGTYYYQRVDPRTDRFGTSVGRWTYTTKDNNWPGGSLRNDNTNGLAGFDYFPRPSSGFIYPSSPSGDPSQIFNKFFMGTLSDNVIGSNSSNPRYTDPDGVLRSGEGLYYATGNDGRPLITGNIASRPVILNRPFRNVGELGYAFRDLPWKNLDFFTANSADAGLLDIFCTSEQPAMTAGKANLNTRQAPALQAIISGAIKNDGAGTQTFTAAPDPGTIANNVVNTNVANSPTRPLANRSDLVSQAATALTYGSSSDNQIKSRREAAARALAEVSNTRTWNLMIDVIAQAGRYPPTATQPTDFVVEGEKRYWLHVAIDRFTDQVIDQQLEAVYE